MTRRAASLFKSLKTLPQVIRPLSSQLDLIGRLGCSSRAIIDEVRFHGSPLTMARKMLIYHTRDIQQRLVREATNMSRLQHPHVVRLIFRLEAKDSVALLMTPVADYNLSQYLATCSATSKDQRNIWLWFSCLTAGLQHIHDKGVMHKDIKPSNILVKNDNVLFADFGSSDTVESQQSCNVREYTELYAAPEIFKGDFKTASDVFSLGCVFLEMATKLLSNNLWQQLRLLQRQWHYARMNNDHWAWTWHDRIWQFARLSITESKIHLLLCVFRDMTNPRPEQRPSAAEIDAKINPHLDVHCDCRKPIVLSLEPSNRKRSLLEDQRSSSRRSFTEPHQETNPVQQETEDLKRLTLFDNRLAGLDKEKTTQELHAVSSQSTKPFIRPQDQQIRNLERQSLCVEAQSTTTTESRLETHIQLLSDTSDENRIEPAAKNFIDMVVPYLRYADAHERFRVSGESTYLPLEKLRRHSMLRSQSARKDVVSKGKCTTLRGSNYSSKYLFKDRPTTKRINDHEWTWLTLSV